MDKTERLERELSAARDELARKRIERQGGPPDLVNRLPYVPDREEAFLHLAALDPAELQSHIDRLKRDIADLGDGFRDPTEYD